MRRSACLALACAGLLGCDAGLEALGWISAPQVGPSPLAGADPERVYAILHFSESFNPLCRDYFGAPFDPRYVKYTGSCEAKELEMTDWLRANGFPELEPGHLRLESFWSLMSSVSAAEVQCRRSVAARQDLAPTQKIIQASDCSPLSKLPTTPWGVPDAELAGIRRPTRRGGVER